MSATYAGVPLLGPTPETEAMALALSPSPGAFAVWPGWQQPQLDFPGNFPGDKPWQIGKFFWPVGATRFAWAQYLVHGKDLEAIRAETTAGRSIQSQPLILADGTYNIAPEMWALAARPIQQPYQTSEFAGIEGNLYLLTLVDDRYYWRQTPMTGVVIEPGTTTWEDLYAMIGSALSVGIDFEDIPAAYLKPAADLVARFQFLPQLLDAVAFSVGQRIVRTYDGEVLAQAVATARGNVDRQWNANPWGDQAGGRFRLKVQG